MNKLSSRLLDTPPTDLWKLPPAADSDSCGHGFLFRASSFFLVKQEIQVTELNCVWLPPECALFFFFQDSCYYTFQAFLMSKPATCVFSFQNSYDTSIQKAVTLPQISVWYMFRFCFQIWRDSSIQFTLAWYTSSFFIYYMLSDILICSLYFHICLRLKALQQLHLYIQQPKMKQTR